MYSVKARTSTWHEDRMCGTGRASSRARCRFRRRVEWNDERVRESRERRERGTHSRQERGGVGDWREGVGVRTGIVEYNLLGTEGD